MYRNAALVIAITFSVPCLATDELATSIFQESANDSQQEDAPEDDASASEDGIPERPIETFYQQVEILRQPQFSLQGLFIKQQIRYRIASTFEVYAPDDKGTQRAVQTISETQLIEADPLSKAAFEQSLLEMRGHSFTYEFDKYSRVLSIENSRDSTTVIDVKKPKSAGMLMSTVIDLDGWKELAQLTLFQPPEGRLSRHFSRKTTHDWGGLGSWYGKTDYRGRSAGRTGQRFSYQHLLEYIPPDPNDSKKRSQLPFTITRATFRTYEAQGEIFYDPKSKRVTSVREVFHAKARSRPNCLGRLRTSSLKKDRTS